MAIPDVKGYCGENAKGAAHMSDKRVSIGPKRNPQSEAAILDAATELLAEAGIAGLSMEAVARKARAGKATLYRWWPSRGALLLAVYQRQKRADPHADTGTLEGDVTAFLRTLLAHWSRPEGQVFRHILAAAQGDADVAEALATYRAARAGALRPMFERAAARGELAPGAPLAEMTSALIALAWYCLLTDDLDTDPGRLARVLVGGWTVPGTG